MSTTELLKNMGTYAMVFGGVGAGYGAFRTWMDSRSAAFGSKENKGEDERYPNLKFDPMAKDALDQLRTYQKHAKDEFDVIRYNLDRLIALQISTHEGKIQASFPYKAKRYQSTLENALKHMRYKLRNLATPHFDTDEQGVQQVSSDYSHNICMDCDSYLMTHRNGDYGMR